MNKNVFVTKAAPFLPLHPLKPLEFSTDRHVNSDTNEIESLLPFPKPDPIDSLQTDN